MPHYTACVLQDVVIFLSDVSVSRAGVGALAVAIDVGESGAARDTGLKSGSMSAGRTPFLRE